MAASIMQAIDTTIANIALPHMQGSLSGTQDRQGEGGKAGEDFGAYCWSFTDGKVLVGDGHAVPAKTWGRR